MAIKSYCENVWRGESLSHQQVLGNPSLKQLGINFFAAKKGRIMIIELFDSHPEKEEELSNLEMAIVFIRQIIKQWDEDSSRQEKEE